MAGCEGELLGANTKDCALLLPGSSQDIKNFPSEGKSWLSFLAPLKKSCLWTF
jgi:hypothetical protein